MCNVFAMKETNKYNDTKIVATLVVAMIYFFVAIHNSFLQRK